MNLQVLQPTASELAALTPMERWAFRLARRMNRGAWKRLWSRCGRAIGARWIHLLTHQVLQVYGLEHLHAADPHRALVLAANHRSYFDLYAVSSIVLRQTTGWREIYFPVRGRFFYQSPLGLLVNFLAAWWSMYPPFFLTPAKRRFDHFAMRELVGIARGGGRVIGFHPEGTRNRSRDPYSYLPAHPGIGKLIKDAQPQVIPVFITGLENRLLPQIAANWTRKASIRIHFGEPIDYAAHLAKPDGPRTYQEIADLVMAHVAALGRQDHALEKPAGRPGEG